jgi:lysozyme
MTIKEFITKHEGRKNKPYKCSAGKNTIGVGWNFDDNPLPPHIADYLRKNKQITDEMIDSLLECSISIAEDNCHDLFPNFDNFSENRKMALIDFLFQLGFTRARKFVHAVAAINTGRWEDAGKEIENSSYFKQVPTRAREVIDLIVGG